MDNANSAQSGDKIAVLKATDSHLKVHDGFSASQLEGYSGSHLQSAFKLAESSEPGFLSPDLRPLFQSPDASTADVKTAASKLDGEISPMTPSDVVRDFKNIHSGLLSGDAKELGEALHDIESKHPELMKNVVKELNRELKDTNAGVEFGVTAENKILLYKNDPLDTTHNNSALQFDPADGSAVVRPVQIREDGSVLIQPGELVNADLDAIAKNIGNGAVCGIKQEGKESQEKFLKSSEPNSSEPSLKKFLEHLRSENAPEFTPEFPYKFPLRIPPEFPPERFNPPEHFVPMRTIDPPLRFKFGPESTLPIQIPYTLKKYLHSIRPENQPYEVIDQK